MRVVKRCAVWGELHPNILTLVYSFVGRASRDTYSLVAPLRTAA